MRKANLHPQELKRLESLLSLDILDTLPEEEYDQIVFLASQICETPIALISLIDEKRQWFKAKVGLDASETSRDFAFCAHAILQDDIFEILDSAKDERFGDNPLATGAPFVKFYAGAPLLAPDGHPIGTVCVIDSVARQLSDDQKKALQALSKQVTRLLELRLQMRVLSAANQDLLFRQTAIENIAEGMVVQASDGSIVDFNMAALEILSLSADELTGKTSFDPSWRAVNEKGEELRGDQHPAMVCLKTGQKQSNFVMGVYSSTSKMKWININSVPLFVTNASLPSHAVTSFTDITLFKTLEETRRTLELRLMEGAKLSSLGIMAGGVAHEINNPLAILRARIAILKKNIEKVCSRDEGLLVQGSAGTFDSDFHVIDKTLLRIEKIIKGLKMYSRESSQDPFHAATVLSIVEDTLSVCSEKLRLESIEVKVNVDPLLEIQCRSSEISQILLNLISNARDAIVGLDEKWIEVSAQRIGQGMLEVRVKDSGRGIPEGVVKKMMDPFYTTKEVGKGTGLGLSLSLGLAQIHGGDIKYELDHGHTCMSLVMPCK